MSRGDDQVRCKARYEYTAYPSATTDAGAEKRLARCHLVHGHAGLHHAAVPRPGKRSHLVKFGVGQVA